MSKFNFKKTAIATVVASALGASGAAMAADDDFVSLTIAGPQISSKVISSDSSLSALAFQVAQAADDGASVPAAVTVQFYDAAGTAITGGYFVHGGTLGLSIASATATDGVANNQDTQTTSITLPNKIGSTVWASMVIKITDANGGIKYVAAAGTADAAAPAAFADNIQRSDTYAGPKLEKAYSDGSSTIYLQFNSAIGNAAVQDFKFDDGAGSYLFADAAGAALANAAQKFNAGGASTVVGVDKNILKHVENDQTVPSTAKMIYVGDGGGATVPEDTATNKSATGTSTKVTLDNTPKLDLGSSTAVLVAENNAGDVNDNGVGEAGATVVDVTILYNSPINTGPNADGDVTVGNATADVEATVANDSAWANSSVRLTGVGDYRFIADSGKLYAVDDGGNNVFSQAELDAKVPVTLKLLKGEGLANIFGEDLSGDTAFTSIYIGSAPAVAVKTADTDQNGSLDGVTLGFGQAMTGTTGAKLFVTGHAGTKAEISLSGSTLSTDTKTLTLAHAESTSAAPAIDWDKDDTIDAKDFTVYDAFTTATTGKVDYQVPAASSGITYTETYDKATGELKKFTQAAKTTVAADGAAPVPKPNPSTVDANNPATIKFEKNADGKTGKLTVTFSENLAVGAAKPGVFLLDGAPVNLLTMNAELPAVVMANPSAPVVTLDGLPVGSVTPGTTQVSIASSPTPTGEDAFNNKIASSTAGQGIYDGGAAQNAPAVTNAFAIDSAVTGETSQVVVSYDREIALESGATHEGQFELQIDTDGGAWSNDVTVGIAKDKVAIATDKKSVTLTLPLAAVNTEVTAMKVAYDGAGGKNRLVSTDTKPVVVAAGTSTDVQYSSNTKKLYVNELKGSLATTPAPGTLLRVDLIADGLKVRAGTANVPCAACGKPIIKIAGFGTVANDVGEARKKGLKTIKATLNFDKGATGNWTAVFGGAGTPYLVTIDVKSGKISGPATGQVFFASSGLAIVDTTYALFDGSGTSFRLNVGANARPTNGFITAAVNVPGSDVWTQILPAPINLQGHLPFVDHLGTAGTITNLGTVDLTKFDYFLVDNTGGQWQTHGPTSQVMYKAKAKKEIAPGRLYFSYDSNGDPSVAVTDAAGGDMGFTLTGNKVNTWFEFQNTPIKPLVGLDGGDGLAFNPDTPAGAWINLTGGIPAGGVATANGDDAMVRVWYPTDGSTPTRVAPKGWDLFTATAAVSDISTLKYEAVICSGNGDQAQTWFDVAPTAENTLSTMKKGQTCFGYEDGKK